MTTPATSALSFERLVTAIGQAHAELVAQASRAVNPSHTLRNWLIGFHIAEYEQRGTNRAQYGDKLIERLVEYESDSDLRDTEQMPLLEDGGIEAFIRREVLPYTPDAWIKGEGTEIGYEVSFSRHFYKSQPLSTLDEIGVDILAIEKEAEGLLDGLLAGGAR